MLGDPPVERTVQRVRQLISEAETQPGGGFRAVLARRSWSRLARAHQSSMMDRWRAYQAVLNEWAAAGAPDDPRPELLARWVGGRRRFGKRLAVTTVDPGPRGPRNPWNQGWVSVFGLPDGQVLDRHQVTVRDFAGLVFRGPALFAVDSAAARSAGGAATGAADGPEGADEPGAPLTRVYRFAEGGLAPPSVDSAAVVALVPRNRGLAAVCADGVLACYGNDGARFAECQLGAADGFARAGVVAAAEPSSGHIAIADGSRVITVDVRDPHRARVVSRIADKIPVTGLCFDGTGGIIVADRDEVRRWPVGAPSAAANGEYETETLRGGHSLVTVGGRDEICLLDRAGVVRYLDKRTLRPVTQRRELTGMTGTALWGQADGSGHALAGEGAVHVAVSPPGLRTLTTRPQATWRVADAATARAVAAIAGRSPAARPFYDLLTACLEYRFGNG